MRAPGGQPRPAVQRGKVPAHCTVRHHQTDHWRGDVVAPGKAQRDRRQQGHTGCCERTGHRRQRRDDEYGPGNECAPIPDETCHTLDHALECAVVGRNAEQVCDSGKQNEQVDGETAIHVLHALTEDRAVDKHHHQRKRTEVYRPQRANEEDDDQSDDAGDVDAQRTCLSGLRSRCVRRLAAGACVTLSCVDHRQRCEIRGPTTRRSGISRRTL